MLEKLTLNQMSLFNKQQKSKGRVKSLHVVDYGSNWKLIQYVITPPEGPDFMENIETQSDNYPRRGDEIGIVSTLFSWKIDEVI